MNKSETAQLADVILNSSVLKFALSHRHFQFFDVGQVNLVKVAAHRIKHILTSGEFKEARKVFIHTIANPVEFVNDESVITWELPKELMLIVEMSKLVGESNE